MPSDPVPRWLTVKQAAARIGVAPDWVYRRIRHKHTDAPPHARRGRLIRIPADEFEVWAKQEVIG